MKKMLILMAMLATALVLAGPTTNYPVMVPYGSSYGSVPTWWTQTNNWGSVTNWQAWQAANSNWTWLAGSLTTNIPPVWILRSNTVASSTASTFGYGAGLVVADTNFLYLSIGTNLWKRVALTNW